MTKPPDHGKLGVIIGIPTPMRLIAKSGGDSWNVSLDDINMNSYDWVKLNRVSGGFDGNIPHYAMLVCFDGCLVIPALPEFRNKQRAVEVFNRVLAELLLGGEYTEAVMPTEICYGAVLPTGYVRISPPTGGVKSELRVHLRSGEASSLDSIALMGKKPMPIEDFESAILRGRTILQAVPKLSPELFLSGITHAVREQWSEALVTVWTSIEQLITHLWEDNVRSGPPAVSIAGRKDFLSDYRTWPASTRIEVLFQKGLVDESLYQELDIGRKARNAVIHEGKAPGPAAVKSAINGLFELLATSSKSMESKSDVSKAKAAIASRIHPEERQSRSGPIPDDEIVAWRHIRHLPGENGWEGQFEQFDLGFKPIEIPPAKTIRKPPRKGT